MTNFFPKIPGVFYGACSETNWEYLDNDTSETNYGRQISCSMETATKFKIRIEEEGYQPDKHPPVFYDAKNKQRIDGELRFLASGLLRRPTWNMCPVSFANERARVLFSTKINNRKNPIARDTDILDVESAVRDLWSIDVAAGISIDEHWIEYWVDDLAEGTGDISPKQLGRLKANLITELHAKNGIQKVKGGDRYLEWKRSVFARLDSLYKLGTKDNKTLDPWYFDIFKNKKEKVVCLEHYTFNSVIYKIIESFNDTFTRDKSGDISLQNPVHFAFAVNIPKDKNKTLLDVRREMFTDLLRDLENSLLAMRPQVMVNGRSVDMERKHFPWNHPDAQHVFIPQDKVNETDAFSLIRVNNREFN